MLKIGNNISHLIEKKDSNVRKINKKIKKEYAKCAITNADYSIHRVKTQTENEKKKTISNVRFKSSLEFCFFFLPNIHIKNLQLKNFRPTQLHIAPARVLTETKHPHNFISA